MKFKKFVPCIAISGVLTLSLACDGTQSTAVSPSTPEPVREMKVETTQSFYERPGKVLWLKRPVEAGWGISFEVKATKGVFLPGGNSVVMADSPDTALPPSEAETLDMIYPPVARKYDWLRGLPETKYEWRDANRVFGATVDLTESAVGRYLCVWGGGSDPELFGCSIIEPRR